MAKKKGEKPKTNLDWFADEIDRMNARNPVVKTRWFVIEVTPGKWWSVGDGHGGSDKVQDPDNDKRVSDYFDTRDEALAWFHDHEPDDGSALKISKQNLRRRITETWSNW